MFPRAKRLARTDFPAVSRGKRLGTEHFSAVLGTSSSGYAVIVSKSVAKSSVARHKLKRRVLEALGKAPLLPQALIVYAKKGSPTLTYAAILSEIRDILRAIR
jgi:ribonuclease P protein component